MDKAILNCMLEKKYINKIKTFCKTNHCTYNHFFGLALEDFLKSYKKSQKLILKENDYDRIKLDLFSFSVLAEYQNKIAALVEEHNLPKVQIVRELIIRFIKKNKQKF